MEINTKENRKYIYLMRNIDTKTAIYFEEETGKFYTYKQEKISSNWGFASMVLAPISIFLSNIFINNAMTSYILACLTGILLGIIFVIYLHKSYSSDQFKLISLTNKDIDLCLENLKKVAWIKITLMIIWLLSYSIMTDAFFETESYQTLLCISILFALIILLIVNFNFIRVYRAKKIINSLKNSEK